MNKELDRKLQLTQPVGLKNNPIFKELLEEVTKDEEKENQN